MGQLPGNSSSINAADPRAAAPARMSRFTAKTSFCEDRPSYKAIGITPLP